MKWHIIKSDSDRYCLVTDKALKENKDYKFMDSLYEFEATGLKEASKHKEDWVNGVIQ